MQRTGAVRSWQGLSTCLQAIDADAAAPTGDQAPRLKGAEADAAGMVVAGVPCNDTSLQHDQQPSGFQISTREVRCHISAGKQPDHLSTRSYTAMLDAIFQMQ